MVCTANICRSPLAAALLRREADRRAGPGVIEVSSAGVRGLVDEPVPHEMQEQARVHGLDLSDHRGATVSLDDLDHPDLVLTMSERQRDYLAAQVPAIESRLFTLKEFARLASHGPDVDDDASSPGDRLTAAVQAAHRARPRVPGPADGAEENVADPYGGSPEEYRLAAEELAALTDVIADYLFGEG